MVAASIAARSAITMRRSQSKDVDGIDDEQPAAIYFSRSPFPMNREYAASSKPYGSLDTNADGTEDKQPAAAIG